MAGSSIIRISAPIGSIQEFVVVVYMMQNHVDGKLDFLRETRRKFTNVSQSICEYMAKFWKMHDRLDDALWEYEQFFELTGLDGEQKIADPERFLSYFEELIVREPGRDLDRTGAGVF